ncbi:MAG: hypothetical protein U0792_18955 [Gemmataceae bacterium]
MQVNLALTGWLSFIADKDGDANFVPRNLLDGANLAAAEVHVLPQR